MLTENERILKLSGEVEVYQHPRREGEEPCICCRGEDHICGHWISLEAKPSKVFPGITNSSLDSYVQEWLAAHIFELRGRKVYITIEAAETPDEHAERKMDEWLDENAR